MLRRTAVWVPLTILALTAAFVLLTIPSARKSGDATRLVRTWFEDVASENYDGAYSKLDRVYRTTVAPSTFTESLSRSPHVQSMRTFHSNAFEWSDTRAKLTGELESDFGLAEVVVYLEYDDTDGDGGWAISGILVNGAPILHAATGG